MNHRERFSQMPPLPHDRRDPSRSEAVRHVQEALQCDLGRASAVFEYLRKNGIIVFRKPPFRWQGVAYVREATQAEVNSDLMARIRRLEGHVQALRNMNAKLRKQYLTHLDVLHPGS